MSSEAWRRQDLSIVPGKARRRGFPAAVFVVLGSLLVGVAACSGASVAGDDTGLEPLVGDWRGVLLSQGGELPFRLRVNPEGSEPAAVVINAGVEQPFASVTRQGAASYTLRFFPGPGDSEIVVKMSPDSEELSGYWRYRHEGSAMGDDRAYGLLTQMPFAATKDDSRRFPRNDPTIEVAAPEAMVALPDLNGDWEVRIVNGGAETTSVGEIVQQDEHVTADVISAGMEGIYRNGLLRLSTFDGFRPVLVHARAQADGTLEGRLWIGDQSDARVTVVRVGPTR